MAFILNSCACDLVTAVDKMQRKIAKKQLIVAKFSRVLKNALIFINLNFKPWFGQWLITQAKK